MKKKEFRGIFAPITTPFERNEVSYGYLADNVNAYNETDLAGYMPLGSNGEYLGLTEKEALRILDLVTRTKTPDKIVVAGCGRESSYATLDFIHKAYDVGLEYAFILTPHYYMDFMTDDALEKYFLDIADHSPVPIVLYSAAKFSAGLYISEDLMCKLARHENIAGLKNSSSAISVSDYKKRLPAGADFFILAGNIGMLYEGLESGAVGGVLSTATWLPEYCCEIYRLYRDGETNKAKVLFEYIHKVSCMTAGMYGVAGVKCGMDLRGLHGGMLRFPLQMLDDKTKKEMAMQIRKARIPSFPCTEGRLKALLDNKVR